MTSDTANAGGQTADEWSIIRSRLAAFTRLHDEGELAEVPCLACGYPTLPKRDGLHICVLCHWQDDGSNPDEPDRPSPRNHGLTLRQAAAHLVETGVFAAPGFALTAPEYFTSDVRAARAVLVAAYERVRENPSDTAARADVRTGRADVMIAIVKAMR